MSFLRFLPRAGRPRAAATFAIALLYLLAAAAAAAGESFLPTTAPFDAWETEIPMRDGKRLAADVYVPWGDGRYPAILVQTPYDKQGLRPWFVGEGRWGPESLFTNTAYAFVVSDWRGRFASQSASSPPTQPGGSEDGFDTVEWIAAQEWSNGNVGTWGPSALGAAQYRTARAQPPALACAVPVVMPLNLTYDIFFPGGALWEEFVATLSGLGWPLRDRLVSHPVYDEYWRGLETSTLIQPEEIDVPMLLVGGWFDIYVDDVIGTFLTLQRRGGERTRNDLQLVIGPWLHRTDQEENGELRFPEAVHYGLGRAERFFDRCLRGIETTSFRPAVTYFQMGTNEWRTAETWPPPSRRLRLHLQRHGLLAQELPEVAEAPSVFAYDPQDPVPTVGGHVLSLQAGPRDQSRIVAREDVLTYSSKALDRDVEVTGGVAVELYVASDRRDTDFVALLVDVDPAGRFMLLSEGIARMRFREARDRETLLEPGEIYAVTVQLTELAWTFRPGHRIGLLVTSSSHPKYNRNRNDGLPLYGEGVGLVATNRVYHDPARPSALLLPVVSDEAPAAAAPSVAGCGSPPCAATPLRPTPGR